MEQYISKSAVVAEIERLFEKAEKSSGEYRNGAIHTLITFRDFLDTNEVKEDLTWEDIRGLYIIFAEVDVDIDFGKTTNIKPETIGYYQEVLKRFRAQKGE